MAPKSRVIFDTDPGMQAPVYYPDTFGCGKLTMT